MKKSGRERKPHAWIVLIVATTLFPFVFTAAIAALKSTSNDPRQWLPRDFAETDRYDWFLKTFGSDEISVLSWPGCTLGNPAVLELADALESSPSISRVQTGQRVLDQLTAPGVGLSRSAAIRRLQGFLIGDDGETTCLVAVTSPEGQSDRVNTVEEIRRLAVEVADLSPEALHLGGPTVDAAAIDLESRRLLFQLAGISAIVSFVVAALRLRSMALAAMILAVAVYSTALALSLLWLTGTRMNLLMTMLPPLTYVLTISSAVHFSNYYRDALPHGSKAQAVRAALAKGWLPCSLAAGTTAIGLVSLSLSKIDPIREFGVFSALGVLSGLLALFVLLPAALHCFPPRLEQAKTAAERPRTHRFSERVVGAITRHHLLAASACFSVMAACAWALPKIESTVKLQDRFLADSVPIKDYRWLEEHIGPMVPLEVVIRFQQDDPRGMIDRLMVLARAQAAIESLDEPVQTVSAINFAPRLPTGSSIRDVITRRMMDRPQTREKWKDAHYLAESDSQQLWRISVRAPAIGDLDYGQFAESIRNVVDPVLRERQATGVYTGVIPLIYKAQRQLLDDLFRSFIAAFGVIALVLAFVLRSIRAAVLAMVPNLFPAVVVFGGVQWVGIPIQIGSVMTASAALGIAVDDTVHFLTWFRRGLEDGVERKTALADAFRRCSAAMVQTTVICASGLVVFAISSFVPILHFAWLMVLLLLAALVGDLILLPAILAGPLGRWFESPSTASPVDGNAAGE
jgi:predicted RND superfamily exporter protein